MNLPHVAVAIEERENPQIAGRPFAIEAPDGPRFVYDLSAAAYKAGVRRAMTLTQARKVCPEITVRPPQPDVYHDTFEAMLHVLTDFTPLVEPADMERSWLSADGLASRAPMEQLLAQELVDRLRREVELSSKVGLAHGKLTSRIVTQRLQPDPTTAATRTNDTMVLPRGREMSFLAGLSVAYLPVDADSVQRLVQLGLTKIRQYAALPSRGILPRFGHQGLRAYRLAHGHDDPRVQPYQAAPFFEAEHVFLDPIADLAMLKRLLAHLGAQVAKPLAEEFKMARAMSLVVTLEDGRRIEQRRIMDEPTVSIRALTSQAEVLLGQIDWGPDPSRAAVEKVQLSAQGLCPTVGRQLNLFRRAHAARQGVERTLRHLQAKLGDDVVHIAHPQEPTSPLPERRAYTSAWEAA